MYLYPALASAIVFSNTQEEKQRNQEATGETKCKSSVKPDDVYVYALYYYYY